MRTIALVSIVLCAACAGQNRPNILLLFADDLGRYASAYADPKNPSANDIITTPAYAEPLPKLHTQLMNELTGNDDPRLDDDAFDRPPRLSVGGK